MSERVQRRQGLSPRRAVASTAALAIGRRLLPFALLLALTTPANGAARVQPRSAGPGETAYPLQRATLPSHLALSPDGAVWMSDEYGGVTRLSPQGDTRDFLTHEFTGEIAVTPDGSAWIANGGQIVRIAATGKVRRFGLPGYGSADAIASAGGVIWVADGGDLVVGGSYRPRIERLSADGTIRALIASVPRGWFGFNGIAGAPDGSVWLTESGHRRGWIGRMTTGGQFSHWALPRSFGDPGRIAAGPDGAIWFTGGQAVGRISSGGQVTIFPLGGGLAPHGIVAGGDGGVWFTGDICLARIVGSGEVTTWPVPGAVQLEGVAAAGDGSFWLADRAGNAVRHFSPSAAPAPCGAPTLTRQAGHTAATVSFQRLDRFDGVDFFTDIHISIARDGQTSFSETVPGLRGYAAFSDSESLSVRDLDVDGEPEVTLLLNWNGAHCCSWSRIYRYDPARGAYVAHNHFWGSFLPALRDPNGDGRPEFVTRDYRFSERFSFDSVSPLQIWSYRHGKLHDVTRRYPRLIRRDAAGIWRLYLRYRKDDARGILPAWVADEYLLGRAAFADRVLEQAAARGELRRRGGFGPRDPRAYIRAVKALLRRTGYSR